MTMNPMNRRIAIGSLATILLAAGTDRARSGIEPDLWFTLGLEAPAPQAPSPLRPADTTALWIPASYVLVPTNGALPNAKTAKTEPVPPDTQLPATVQNLRRVDNP